MTISELTETYYFHDSAIAEITHDDRLHQLVITIEFCFWAQEAFKEGMPETGLIKLVFHEVEDFDCDGLPGEIDYFSILDASADNNKLTLSILDDFHNSFYELYVVSPAVDFIVIEEENGQSQPGR